MGLDNAGKTSILYQLHLGQAVVTQPTVGCNVEQIQHKNLTFEVRWSFKASCRRTGGLFCCEGGVWAPAKCGCQHLATSEARLCIMPSNQAIVTSEGVHAPGLGPGRASKSAAFMGHLLQTHRCCHSCCRQHRQSANEHCKGDDPLRRSDLLHSAHILTALFSRNEAIVAIISPTAFLFP